MKEKTLRFENEQMAKGFTMVPNQILLNQDIPYKARFLYAILLQYAWNNRQCFPGQTKLAEDVGVSTKTIRRWLATLERHGLIEVIQRGLNRTNVYIIKDISQTPMSDRACASGQEPAPESGQDRTPTSDKEYSVEEDSVEEDAAASPRARARKRLISEYEKMFGVTASPAHISRLHEYTTEDGMDLGVVIEAMRRGRNGDKPYGLTKYLLDEWVAAGVKTMQDVQAKDPPRKNRTGQNTISADFTRKEIYK